jgi:hypothetical protein
VGNSVPDIKGRTETRVFENRVLRRTLGQEKGWRNLHNEDFSSRDRMRW